jgi:hypothetical protein
VPDYKPGETVFFARMQDAGSLCRNLTATGHHSALSWLGEDPVQAIEVGCARTSRMNCIRQIGPRRIRNVREARSEHCDLTAHVNVVALDPSISQTLVAMLD